MAVAAQFFYVAAQAGIFSFFINYMTAEVPAMPASWARLANARGHSGSLHDWLSGWFETGKSGMLALSDKGASNLASVGFVCFLIGRFTGAGAAAEVLRAQDARPLRRDERGRDLSWSF